MIRNAILIMLSIIFLVTAGSLAYVYYCNTKAQIIEDKEKRIAEMPPKKEPPTKKELEKEKVKEKAIKEKEKNKKPSAEDEAPEDVAHLVQDMYITPMSASDRAYEYEEHESDAGIFLHPYVIEHKGAATSLHLKAGFRGNAPLNFDTIIVKCDSGEKQFRFTQSAMKTTQKAGLTVSFYDLPASGETESLMHAIAASQYVQVLIAGHEEENKILSPAEIRQFKNVVLLYDELNDGKE